MAEKFLKIHPNDNVLVALADLKQGETVTTKEGGVTLLRDIPPKHKFLTKSLGVNEEIIMYGVPVGRALEPLQKGEVITTQNVKHKSAEYAGRSEKFSWKAPDVSRWKNKTFDGFHRADGQVGVANYWVVIPMVFCENRNVDIIRQAFEEELGFASPNQYKNLVKELVAVYKTGNEAEITKRTFEIKSESGSSKLFKNIDGIKFLTHEGGCGGTRKDAEALCHLFAGYIHNPNVAGATILSLGCQNAQTEILLTQLNKLNAAMQKPLVILEQQKEGTEQQLLTKAIQQTFQALIAADKFEEKTRTPQ